jgi:hypothetical protein
MGSILTISDVTRMSRNTVCIAGYLEDGTCVRPQFHYGHITEDWLFQNGEMAVRPFAQIEIDFLPGHCHTEPPHTEDRLVASGYRLVRHIEDPGERAMFLDGISEPRLSDCFGAPLLTDGYSPKRFVHPGDGTQSLATVRGCVTFLEFGANQYNNRRYEIGFSDAAGFEYRAPITDLALRAYLDQGEHELNSSGHAATRLGRQLETSNVWLRVGFARGFDQGGKTEPRCYLQLNGLYSIPDYLEGKCWGDFAVRRDPLRPGNPATSNDPQDTDDIPF